MRRALAYVFGTVTKPRQAFTLILFDSGGLSISFFLLVAVAAAWAFTSLEWAMAGFEPRMSPWLAISPEHYYFWEALMTLPVMTAGWLLVSGFVQLVSHRLGGGGSFEATAKLLALSISISSFVLLIPSLVLAFFALVGARDAAWYPDVFHSGNMAGIAVLVLIMAEAVWMGWLTVVAIRAAHKLRPRLSFIVAIPTVGLYHGFVLVFLR